MPSAHKYFYALLITLAIFLGLTWLSNYFDAQRLNEVKAIDASISTDILSSETQFDLLKETPCEDLGVSSLSQELDSLGSRLSFLESSRGTNDAQVIGLKLNYSLLEIKDFILMQSLSEKCHTKPVFVLYFYSNSGDCPSCSDMGAVLTALREDYPAVRVYSFDYHANLSAVDTFEKIYKVKDELPATVIHGKPIYGLQSLSAIEDLMPELKNLSTTTATTTTN